MRSVSFSASIMVCGRVLSFAESARSRTSAERADASCVSNKDEERPSTIALNCGHGGTRSARLSPSFSR